MQPKRSPEIAQKIFINKTKGLKLHHYQTRLYQSRRLKKTMYGLSILQTAFLLDMIPSINPLIHSINLMFHFTISYFAPSISLDQIRLKQATFDSTRLQNTQLLDIFLHLYHDLLLKFKFFLHQSYGDYPNRSFLTRHN